MERTKIAEAAGEMVTAWGMRVVGVLVVVVLAFMVAGWTRSAMLRSFERTRFDATLARFFSNMTRYAILVAAVLGCLGVFGIQTTSFAAVIAAGGLAIGLAFQGTLSNFAAGVMLLVFRPFKVGDVIVVGGIVGTVQEIELFTCELTALDNRRIIVPNSSIFGATIENLTHHPTRRVDIGVGTSYGADVDQTRKVLEETLGKVQGVLADPPPQVFLKGLGESSVDWQLRGWCNTEDYWDVWQRILRDSKVALDRERIGIPFPQRDVHVDLELLAALKR